MDLQEQGEERVLLIVAGEDFAILWVFIKVVERGFVNCEVIIGFCVTPAGRNCLLFLKTFERSK